MKVKPIILVGTGAYGEGPRKAALDRLIAELTPQCHVGRVELRVRVDSTGSTSCWLELLKQATETDATHAVYLPDDAILVPHFVEALKAAIASKPDEILCCLSNHADAKAAYVLGAKWYTTADGYVGFAGTMPMQLVREFLEWRAARFKGEDYPGDASLNLFAMLTRRRIWKPLPSLVQHDISIPSTLGNDWQNTDPLAKVLRTSQVWLPEDGLQCQDGPEVMDLGSTFNGQCWDIVRRLPPEDWDVDAMYEAYEPTPKDERPRVAIIVPTYGATADVLQETNPSRDAVVADLEAHGIHVTMMQLGGDSHVDRMRQSCTHEALKTGCTHMVWWDADISCDNPTTVRAMLTTGHDVVAGACPFKRPGGEVVHNVDAELVAEWKKTGRVDAPNGCVEVRDAGTGFMLVSRAALVKMMHAYKHLCYLSRGKGQFGEPLWALYDGTVSGDPMDLWDRDFLSEDWHFCRLWQQLGEKVYVFVPATFAHWGLFPYRGSFEHHHGLRLREERKEAGEGHP